VSSRGRFCSVGAMACFLVLFSTLTRLEGPPLPSRGVQKSGQDGLQKRCRRCLKAQGASRVRRNRCSGKPALRSGVSNQASLSVSGFQLLCREGVPMVLCLTGDPNRRGWTCGGPAKLRVFEAAPHRGLCALGTGFAQANSAKVGASRQSRPVDQGSCPRATLAAGGVTCAGQVEDVTRRARGAPFGRLLFWSDEHRELEWSASLASASVIPVKTSFRILRAFPAGSSRPDRLHDLFVEHATWSAKDCPLPSPFCFVFSSAAIRRGPASAVHPKV